MHPFFNKFELYLTDILVIQYYISLAVSFTMSILLYGSKGAIGQELIKFHRKLKGSLRYKKIVCGNARCDDYQELKAEIDTVEPDIVIASIGRTYGEGCPNIDYLQDLNKLPINLRDNLQAPLNLARITEDKCIPFVYIGTGCIFEYDQEHRMPTKDLSLPQLYDCHKVKGFRELDKPNFTGSAYSTVKGTTDMLLQSFKHVLNVRIRMPIFGFRHPRDFITKILSYPKLIDIPNSMTVLPEMLPVLWELIENKHTGTINLVNPGVLSPADVVDIYNRTHPDNSHNYQKVSLEDLKHLVVARRSNNYLVPSALVKASEHVRPLHEAIENLIKNY